MQIPILIEILAGEGYRATAGNPFAFSVVASSRDEALRKLREQIENRLVAGAELCSLEIPHDNPWLKCAGIWDPNDPLVQEWIEIMAENRRKADDNPNEPWENTDESSGI